MAVHAKAQRSACYVLQAAQQELRHYLRDNGALTAAEVMNKLPFLNRGLAFQSRAWQASAAQRLQGGCGARGGGEKQVDAARTGSLLHPTCCPLCHALYIEPDC